MKLPSAIRANGSGPNRVSVSQNCRPNSASQARCQGQRRSVAGGVTGAGPSADAHGSSIGGHRTWGGDGEQGEVSFRNEEQGTENRELRIAPNSQFPVLGSLF